jgi:glutathione synthetase
MKSGTVRSPPAEALVAIPDGPFCDERSENVELLASVPRPGSITRHSSGASDSFKRKDSGDALVLAPLEESSVPLPLPQHTYQLVTKYAIDWTLLNGLIVNFGDVSKPSLQHAPFSLLPTPFPTHAFHEALVVQQKLNLTMHRLREDTSYLLTTLQSLAERDEFTGKLSRIMRAVHNEGLAQTVSLALHRSDFVLHLPTAATLPHLRLASIQTANPAFFALGPLLSDMHRHLLSRFPLCESGPKALPPNNALLNIVDLFARTVALYCSMYALLPGSACVLVIESSSDAIDPSALELRRVEQLLWDRHRVSIHRRSLSSVSADVVFRVDRSIHVADTEVGLVFFRGGLRASDYASASEWSARLQLERSRAVKCPTVADQLSGMLRILLTLADPKVLDAFASDDASTTAISAVMSGWHLLTAPGFDSAGPDPGLGHGDRRGSLHGQGTMLRRVLDAPEEYVLQACVGRGSHVMVGGDLVDHLLTLAPCDRPLHVLQERARPPMRRNYFVQNTSVVLGNAVSELGVFGAVLADGAEVLHASVLGHVLRSTMTDLDGGMSSGLAVLDSPFLVS